MDEESEIFSALEEAAVGQHEMYTTWVKAGFTEQQAFELLKVVVGELARGVSGC